MQFGPGTASGPDTYEGYVVLIQLCVRDDNVPRTDFNGSVSPSLRTNSRDLNMISKSVGHWVSRDQVHEAVHVPKGSSK